MAIGLEDKKAIVAEVNETASSALSLVVADSRGCTVSQMTALRKEARDNQVMLRIVRNTLLKFLKGQNRLARFSSLDDEVCEREDGRVRSPF